MPLASPSHHRLRIGVDCGGTNTDAVIIDNLSKVILATAKTPTTSDVKSGVEKSIQAVLNQAKDTSEAFSPQNIGSVCIGTTHFVNALLQRSDELVQVAVIRLCGVFTRSCPPFAGFPADLRMYLEGPSFFVEGGLQIDGSFIGKVSRSGVRKRKLNGCT